MKKTLLTFVLLAVTSLFIACSSDDDGGDTGRIVGVWREHYFWSSSKDRMVANALSLELRNLYVFTSDMKYAEYLNEENFKNGKAAVKGTYSFDGTYLVVNGGYKRKVTFTEDGNGFEWERTAIVKRYK